jgi:hypothetical protein
MKLATQRGNSFENNILALECYILEERSISTYYKDTNLYKLVKTIRDNFVDCGLDADKLYISKFDDWILRRVELTIIKNDTYLADIVFKRINEVGAFVCVSMKIYDEGIKENFTRENITKVCKKSLELEYQKVFQELGIKDFDDKLDSVILELYIDGKFKRTEELKDFSVKEMCERFYKLNRQYTYCNGCYYTFKEDRFMKMYIFFIGVYDGNFFLDMDVRSGLTVD